MGKTWNLDIRTNLTIPWCTIQFLVQESHYNNDVLLPGIILYQMPLAAGTPQPVNCTAADLKSGTGIRSPGSLSLTSRNDTSVENSVASRLWRVELSIANGLVIQCTVSSNSCIRLTTGTRNVPAKCICLHVFGRICQNYIRTKNEQYCGQQDCRSKCKRLHDEGYRIPTTTLYRLG
jgi:hypothetical protein